MSSMGTINPSAMMALFAEQPQLQMLLMMRAQGGMQSPYGQQGLMPNMYGYNQQPFGNGIMPGGCYPQQPQCGPYGGGYNGGYDNWYGNFPPRYDDRNCGYPPPRDYPSRGCGNNDGCGNDYGQPGQNFFKKHKKKFVLGALLGGLGAMVGLGRKGKDGKSHKFGYLGRALGGIGKMFGGLFGKKSDPDGFHPPRMTRNVSHGYSG